MHCLFPRHLACSLCDNSLNQDLLRACLGNTSSSGSNSQPGVSSSSSQLGGGNEVVLLQASSSYFAYEPILRALQKLQPSALLSTYFLHTDAGQGAHQWPQRVQLPAFMADAGIAFDLTAVVDAKKASQLSREAMNRCVHRFCFQLDQAAVTASNQPRMP